MANVMMSVFLRRAWSGVVSPEKSPFPLQAFCGENEAVGGGPTFSSDVGTKNKCIHKLGLSDKSGMSVDRWLAGMDGDCN